MNVATADMTADMTATCVPPDDGLLRGALADLDTKLSAYVLAMREAHAHLDALARQAVPAAPQQGGSCPPDLEPERTNPVDSRFRGNDEGEAAEAIPDKRDKEAHRESLRPERPQGGSPCDRREAGSTQEPGVTGVLKRAPSRQDQGGPATQQPPSAGQEPASSVESVPVGTSADGMESSASHDDEVLLASLDPQTAQAVRVMRRLTPGKSSVRELLAEYQATHTNATAVRTEKKKSWFHRGR